MKLLCQKVKMKEVNIGSTKVGRYRVMFFPFIFPSPEVLQLLPISWSNKGLFFLLFILLLIFVFRWVVSKLRYKHLMSKTIFLADRIIDSDLRAIRSQVNPHFLSNSLVGLQQLIVDGEHEKAINFIGLYGKVMRTILIQSEYDFVLLEDKINALKNYVQLENIVYGQPVEFNIHIHGNTFKQVRIPSMILQPLLENTFRHGFKNQGDVKRKIDLDLKFGKFLEVVLTDNGAGLDKGKLKNPGSTGIKLIEKRMELYRLKFRTDFSIDVSNIEDANGKTLGTKVRLQMPYEFRK